MLIAGALVAVTSAPVLAQSTGLTAEPGSIYGWGRNSECQAYVITGSQRCPVDPRAELGNFVEIAGGFALTAARTDDGSLVVLGNVRNPPPASISEGRYSSVRMGGNGTLFAITEDQQLVGWDLWGESINAAMAGLGATAGVSVSQVDVGSSRPIVLTTSGDIITWSENRPSAPVPPELTRHGDVRQVASVGVRYLALDGAGGLHIWPADASYGTQFWYDSPENQVPAEVASQPVKKIVGGRAHNIVLTDTGAVVAWGQNDKGQTDVPELVKSETIIDIAAGQDYSLALTATGRIIGWGDNNSYSGGYQLYGGPAVAPDALSDRVVTAIAASTYTSYAITRMRLDAPTVLVDPSDASVVEGEDVRFSAEADGSETSVVWEQSDNGTDWGAAQGEYPNRGGELVISSAELEQSNNQYRAVFTNEGGSTTTRAATLTVNPKPLLPDAPSVVTHPDDVTVTAGEDALFTADAEGLDVSVSWEQSDNGTDWTAAERIGRTLSDQLIVPSTTLAQNGHQYRAVFTNEGGSATTRAATLTVESTAIVPPTPKVPETGSNGQKIGSLVDSNPALAVTGGGLLPGAAGVLLALSGALLIFRRRLSRVARAVIGHTES